ncbi:MAG: alkylphosphonate utilization protein [Saprospiraceae bacterium]
MDDKKVTKDSNGNVLAEGDAVLLTKDLKVKGFNKDLKRGTLIKNIRLTSDPGEIEGKVEGSMLVVKTMYLKKK